MSDKPDITLSGQPHWDDVNIPNPQGCDSSDAVTVYSDGSACCYSCMTQLFPNPLKYGFEQWENNEGVIITTKEKTSPPSTSSYTPRTLEQELKAYEKAAFKGFPDRKLTIQTAQFFGVKTDRADNIYFPYYNKETKYISGFKIRTPEKQFRIIGDITGPNIGLFGQQKFKAKGKYCTTHEGEFDALAGYQMMGSRFCNLSIPTGAPSALKGIKNNLDYLSTFEKNVLSFDGDLSGKEAMLKCAPVFEPGTCLILEMPEDYKDACEWSKKDAASLWMQLFWEAKVFTPAGIVNLADDFEKLFDRTNKESLPYPWEGLNEKTHGLRYKELVCLCSGTGMGKTTVVRSLCHHLLENTDDNIGCLFLEEDPDRTKLGIMGYHCGKSLHLNEVFVEQEREFIKEAYDNTVGTGRFYAFNHFGSCEVEAILSRMRYLIKGLDCKWIILDHLSIIVSGLDNGDERKAIDLAMTKLRTLVEETGAGLILVSHLKRVGQGKSHEDGGQISLSHLRGSQAIAQLSDIVIGLERDQQATNKTAANTTKVRVLKNRYTGKVGLCSHLLFNEDTGRLQEVDPESLAFDDEDDEF